MQGKNQRESGPDRIQLWFISAEQAGIPPALQRDDEDDWVLLSGVRCEDDHLMMHWLRRLDSVGARSEVLLLPCAGVYAPRSVWCSEEGGDTPDVPVDVDLPHGLWVGGGAAQLREALLPHRPRLWQTLCRSLVARLIAPRTPQDRELLRCTDWHRDHALLLHANEKAPPTGRAHPTKRRRRR